MADVKAEKKVKKTNAPAGPPDEDTRYRFIGFEVYPQKSEKFWKSDAETKKYIEKVRSVKVFSDWDRDFSMVHAPDFAFSDKVVLTISNLILLGAMFLPWTAYRTTAGFDGDNWFGLLGVIGGVLGGAFESSTAIGLCAICGLTIVILTPILAILGLLAVHLKAKDSESVVRRLRLVLRLNYLGFAAWILGIVFSLLGGDLAPLTRAGVMYGGESFNIVTVFSLISYGMIITLGMFYLNAIKSNDL